MVISDKLISSLEEFKAIEKEIQYINKQALDCITKGAKITLNLNIELMDDKIVDKTEHSTDLIEFGGLMDLISRTRLPNDKQRPESEGYYNLNEGQSLEILAIILKRLVKRKDAIIKKIKKQNEEL